MNQMIKVLAACACALSMTGPAPLFAKEKSEAGDEKKTDKTLTVMYMTQDENEGRKTGKLSFVPETDKDTDQAEQTEEEAEEKQEEKTYISARDLQTFVMDHAPEDGEEVDLSRIYFDESLKDSQDVTLEEARIALPADTDTIWLKTVPDDGEYDIVFYSAPGTILQQEVLAKGDPIVAPETDPEETGKIFEGWDLPADAAARENLYLYPEWKEDNTVTTTDSEGKETSKVPSTAYDGNNSEKTDTADSDKTADKAVTSVVLTFDPGNGQSAQELTVEKGSKIDPSAITTPAKEGYAFKGWQPAVPETAESSETFQAVYEKIPETFTVTWKASGKTIREDEVTEGDKTPTPPEVSAPEGQVLREWSPAPAETVTENVTYTAVFDEEKPAQDTVTISFTGTEEPVDPMTVKKGTDLKDIQLPVPAKTGYTFKGWSGAKGPVESDVTLAAEFERNEYTVSWYSGDGLLEEQKVLYGDPTPTVKDPSREGFTFEGWSPEVAATVTADARYEAVWKMIPAKDLKVTIQYLEEGTRKPVHYANVVEVKEGSRYDVSRFDKPEIKGYTYVRTEGSLSGTADQDTTVTVWYTPARKDASGTQGTDTSTDTNAMLYGGIALAAVAVIAVLVFLNRKKK